MISYTVGQLYTANTAKFPLTAVQCARKLNEFAAWMWSGDFAASVQLAEVYTNTKALVFYEKIGASDSFDKTVYFKVKETVTIKDHIIWNAVINLLDSCAVAELPRMHPSPIFRESVGYSDDFLISTLLLLQDGVTVKDVAGFVGKWKRTWHEYQPILEKSWKNVAFPLRDTFGCSDRTYKGLWEIVNEKIKIEENLHWKSTWNRMFEENVSVGEREYARYLSAYKEVCSVFSSLLHGPSGVLYDISFSSGPMTEDEFLNYESTPAGYSPFVDFRVGDYEYKDAMYRFIMQKKKLGVNPMLYDLAVHVDIPDTEDHGNTAVNAETTRVYFNKHFYNPPEVVATSVAGTESGGISVPVVLSTDKSDDAGRYFEVELQNSEGTLVSGRIAWTARGY